MSKVENTPEASDCIIVPYTKCPGDCMLKNISTFDQLEAAKNPGHDTVFVYRANAQVSPMEFTLAAVNQNMDATLDLGISSRNCKNLNKLLKASSHIY